MTDLADLIRDVPDFPRRGVVFKDITPLLQDPAGFERAISEMARRVAPPEAVVAVESRGFIFGAALALRWKVPFVPARKFGKLPGRAFREVYSLEYGEDTLEIHADALRKGQSVVIVDDLLATGGTARATVDLVRQGGGQVHGVAFLIELVDLNGRAKLEGENVRAVLQY